jgi:hypothetical protein
MLKTSPKVGSLKWEWFYKQMGKWVINSWLIIAYALDQLLSSMVLIKTATRRMRKRMVALLHLCASAPSVKGNKKKCLQIGVNVFDNMLVSSGSSIRENPIASSGSTFRGNRQY